MANPLLALKEKINGLDRQKKTILNYFSMLVLITCIFIFVIILSIGIDRENMGTSFSAENITGLVFSGLFGIISVVFYMFSKKTTMDVLDDEKINPIINDTKKLLKNLRRTKPEVYKNDMNRISDSISEMVKMTNPQQQAAAPLKTAIQSDEIMQSTPSMQLMQ